MKRKERWWMYDRYDNGRNLRPEFLRGVDEFIEFCKANPESPGLDEVRCPCPKCKNRRMHDADTVKVHVYRKGFIPDYYDWYSHGEELPRSAHEPSNPYREMIFDALGNNSEPSNVEEPGGMDEEPNPQAKVFLDLLKASEEPLYEGSSMSVLEMASRIVSLKCEYNLPHRCVDAFASLVKEAIPNNNNMSNTFYDTKKILEGLELPHERIHACPKGCMLFWRTDAHLDRCTVCDSDRYKRTSKGSLVPMKVLIYFPITPNCKRLYATKNVAEEMTWHAKNPRAEEKMAHPSDSEAWKHLDRSFDEFASEPRNVRLGLCTDGFGPHGKFGGQYSCWPVILTPYNLPPSMCMKKPFMFLSLLVPGPKNPKGNLDVYMQPLIEELKQLWDVGATTYDISRKQNFNMRAAILWTISDFPAYGMLSGWATAGKKACPYCLDKSKAFWLDHGVKFLGLIVTVNSYPRSSFS
ncbi:uncharacterized protein LOC125499464 [Beta vulgaris subsp. vulgaris]|uniref:uncharacterized protein LOC125499464 n=1 Tax=Beta vulgaris subsp. vulgaris TaxID=3555 RepID=UPI002546D86C|nr:uncharacterized protein LOC125499464 [Beta vulgaris subsp. vulgaris]